MSKRFVRRRAPAVEAMRFDGRNTSEILEWANAEGHPLQNQLVRRAEPDALWVLSPVGVIFALEGSWIVKESPVTFTVVGATQFDEMFEEEP